MPAQPCACRSRPAYRNPSRFSKAAPMVRQPVRKPGALSLKKLFST